MRRSFATAGSSRSSGAVAQATRLLPFTMQAGRLHYAFFNTT